MKFRKGFVTNSSSSSFVISYNDNNDLVTSILDVTGEETWNIERIDDINDLLDKHCYDSLEEALDNEDEDGIFHTVQVALEQGKTVYLKKIGYRADEYVEVLKVLENLFDDFEILYGGELNEI